MDSSIKISVIVPVYNCEFYIEKCINSIVNQTFSDIEIILVDDGSRDNSGKICEDIAKKDNRITVIHQDNGGAAKARNTGMSVAKGEYIGFVDADDWVEKEMYGTLYQVASEKKLDLVRCNLILHEFNKEKINWIPNELTGVSDEETIKREIVPLFFAPECEGEYDKKLNPSCIYCIFRKDIIDKHCIEFKDIRSGQDAIFTIEYLWNAKKIELLATPLYHYVKQESDSLSIGIEKFGNYDDRRQSREIITKLIKNSDYYPIYQKRWEQSDRRYVFLQARIATIYNKNATKKQKLSLLKELLNSVETKRVFSKKIEGRLPFQLKGLYFLIKHGMYRSLYTAIRIKYRR